jgi:hypothetical protein
MATHHVVVDGSNLATEGRSAPSLAQLDEAVRAYLDEDPSAEVTVVVDASFSHRIDPKERDQLEAAELHGEVVAPPAGAIGRGDAFVLRIAERTGAVVLSNDSFQEFHDEHPWLFDEGRLVGGKPVPGVGWIFTPRRPVRGPRSRKQERPGEGAEVGLSAVRKAAEVAKALQKAAKGTGAAKGSGGDKAASSKGKKKEKKEEKAAPAEVSGKQAKGARAGAAKGAKAAARPKVEKAPPKKAGAPAAEGPAKRAKQAGPPAAEAPAKRAKKAAAPAAAKPAKKAKKASRKAAESRGPARRRVGVKAAIHQATAEVLAPPEPPAADGAKASGRRRRRPGPPPAVNEPLAFITFVAEHPVGSTLDGVVASFTSHGAMVDVTLPDGVVLHCYAPLTGLGSPPPRAAREVLSRGEERRFALVALDPPRRMAELALPEFATGDGDRRGARVDR